MHGLAAPARPPRARPEHRAETGHDGARRRRTPVGILAELDGKTVGWCSVAPRQTYRNLSSHQDGGETGIWSIVCFYVPRELRGGGLAAALLDAAIDHAFAKGASTIEAYPVDPASPSYRFMGFRDMFAVRGFHEIGMAGSRRHVMRLKR
ncbi:GNAT family N-acetyltransferase [Mesorhizobium sp. ArgA1]